jgi:hypothetical protein
VKKKRKSELEERANPGREAAKKGFPQKTSEKKRVN